MQNIQTEYKSDHWMSHFNTQTKQQKVSGTGKHTLAKHIKICSFIIHSGRWWTKKALGTEYNSEYNGK